jgi:deoxyadenosine/deoxycytidine kinase
MILLEGTIGAGKSTFLRLLKDYLPQLHIYLEPVHSWDKVIAGASLLGNFYHNPQRWGYTFETFALFTRFKEHMHVRNSSNSVIITERSLFSGHYVFASNSYAQGIISELEWQLYSEWFNFLVTTQCHVPSTFIYLRVEPHIAFERIQKRARHAENNIPLSYIEQICEAHDNFLIKKKDVLPALKNVPVLTLECSADFEQDSELFQEHLAQIQEHLNIYSANSLKAS